MHNYRKTVRKTLWVIAGAVFLVSVFMLWNYQREMNTSSAATEALVQIAITPNTRSPVSGDREETILAPDVSEDDVVLQETAPISIDFDALLQENADIVAWIYCPDTPINYPVVQSADNSYYLRRLVNGAWNSSGTLFLDYRNAKDFSDVNSVIYGHNMKNDSMFGTLTGYKNQDYYEQHPVFYLLTPENDYKVELLAGYITPSDSAIYDISVMEGKTADEVISSTTASTFTSEADLSGGEHLVTLSTCSYEYDDARYVVIGVLKRLIKS